jgi:hypothetical protein
LAINNYWTCGLLRYPFKDNNRPERFSPNHQNNKYSRKSDVEAIAKNTGLAVEDIRKVNAHTFFNEYDLGDEKEDLF